MEKPFREEQLEQLFRGILTLQTPEECRLFFKDLCTTSELQEMSRRLHAARMLHRNRAYGDISEDTGLSTATISRVNRALRHGYGYVTILDRLEKMERRR